MEGGDNKFAKFTVPTLKAFLKVHSQNVSGNKQELVAHARRWQKTYFFHELAICWLAEKRCNDTFFHSPSPFPCNFCKRNKNGIFYCFAIPRSTSIVIHSVKQRLLRNGPGIDAAISCAKDYKGHSLVQTSFTELPSRLSRLFKGDKNLPF